MLRVAEWAAREQRHGNHSDLRHVDATIKARTAGRRRHRDTQFSPVALGRKAQLFDCRAKHVVGNADSALGQHDPLRRKRTVGQVAALPVQLCQSVKNFFDDKYCRAS